MPEVSNFPHTDLRPVALGSEETVRRRPTSVNDHGKFTDKHEFSRQDVNKSHTGSNIILPCPSFYTKDVAISGTRSLNFIPRDHALFWQGDVLKGEIELVEGIVRAVYLCENGGRQILTFFWPGSIIDAGGARSAFFTAETVTPCSFRQPRINLPIGASRPGTAEMSLLQEMIDLLRGISGRCALSRIAWFLMRMREHLPRGSMEPDVLRLAIPRLDMADYLGLSLETVSRCLTELKVKRAIDLPNRKTIRFTDMRQLNRIANG